MLNRIAAIDFLKEGKSFRVGNLLLSVDDGGNLQSTGWSQSASMENLTKSNCLVELKEVKQLFHEMLQASSALRKYLEGKSIQFNLYHDDYGKGSLSICSEKNNIVEWQLQID